MARTYVDTLPANAIPCDGPLMYDLDHHITPDGRLFSIHPTTRRIQEINISKENKWSWGSAKQKMPDDTIENMLSIDGFYEHKNGRVIPTALLAYYFIEKINPDGMRAIIIDPNAPLHATNLRWGSKREQDTVRLAIARTQVDPENISKIVEDINIDEYTEWNDSGYYVKNDGTRVVNLLGNGTYRELRVYPGTDNYMNVVLRIDGNPKIIRMNRLMAAIHHGLDLNSDLVVDHRNGITDNTPDKLEITTMKENTRRGESACPIIKVDKNTMRVVEEIRCIQEYIDNHPDYSYKTILRIKNTDELYDGFYWLNKRLEGILYVHNDDGTIRITQINQKDVLKKIRITIQQYHENNTITEDMIPLNDIGNIIHTDTIINVVSKLDPRGVGSIDSILNYQKIITNHLPCCRIVSYHGENTASRQIIICLKTMLLFIRSADNLGQINRTCPLCVCDRSATRQQFMPDDSESNIPVYSFTAAASGRAQGDPLAFRGSYTTIIEAIESKKAYTPDKLKAIRQSLFGLVNNMSNSWAKETNKLARTRGHPKRALAQDLYWSFYPPVNGYMSETNPDWLLTRRLNCATMLRLRDAVVARRA